MWVWACYGGDSGGGDDWVGRRGVGLVMVMIVVVVMVGWVGGRVTAF